MSALTAVERPNGKLYRPRKIAAQIVSDGDEETGVVIFGTHDLEQARQAAEQKLAAYNESLYSPPEVAQHLVGEGKPVWWRAQLSHFEDDSPYYVFREDPERGRAGVEFSIEYRDQRFGALG
jgi:hypothetical protein